MKRAGWIVVVLVVLVGLALVWYLVSPLFIDKSVNEDLASGDVLVQGSFVDADSSHKVSGGAKIVDSATGRVLQFENFEATNGPDLKVYLANDLNADDYVSLGDLKGNIGNQNYEVPAGVNAEDYEYVLIWCERFSVLFGSARI